MWGCMVRLIPEEFSLAAYRKVFESPYIASGYANTLVRIVLGTTSSIVVTVLVAYPLSRGTSRTVRSGRC